MPRDERFAVSRRWKRVEIARASPRTVATLDVLGLKIPFRWHRSNPPCPGFVSALCYLNRARRPSGPTDSARSYRHVPYRPQNGRNGPGRATKPADDAATALFIAPYFLVWGAFGVAALLALSALGLMGAMTGPLAFASAGTLVAAGLWQVTRTKEVCLTHCTSPMSFVLHHWRSGRAGAVRMGFRHSLYCIGCCWLFMLVLFISGSMSLVWIGGLSVVIFTEQLGVRQDLFARAIGVVLVALGGLAVFGAVLPR